MSKLYLQIKAHQGKQILMAISMRICLHLFKKQRNLKERRIEIKISIEMSLKCQKENGKWKIPTERVRNNINVASNLAQVIFHS